MSYISTCLSDGAVGLYALSDASVADSAPAIDQAGIATGVYVNNGWTGGQTGLIGAAGFNAAKITAGGGQMNIPDAVGNRTTDVFTWEFWMSIAAWPGSTAALFTTANPGIEGFMRLSPAGLFRLTLQATGDVAQSTVAVPTDSAFHHIVAAKAGSSSTKLYLDSVDVTQFFGNLTFPSTSGFGYQFLNDPASEVAPAATSAMVAIYQAPLSTAQVLNHYQIGTNTLPLSGVPGPPPMLGLMNH